MMEELTYTQEQVAERMGKERCHQANYIYACWIRHQIIQFAVRKNDAWDMRAIINVDTVDKQLYIFNDQKT